MEATPDSMRTACHECDLLITIDALVDGASALCPRCGRLLTKQPRDGMTKSLALATAAGMLLVASNLFPFLSLQASGLEQVMTLPRTAVAFDAQRAEFATVRTNRALMEAVASVTG